jgi:hypothetical protein
VALKSAGGHLRHGYPVPTPSLTATAVKGYDPVSLHGLMTIILTIEAVLAKGQAVDSVARLFGILSDSEAFGYPTILAPGSIIPAMRSPDPKLLASLRDTLIPGMNRTEFSRRLMQGALGNVQAESLFLGHLEDGYKSGKLQGLYKVTEATARLLYERFSRLAEGKIEMPPYDAFAPLSVLAGDRCGQVSRALRVPAGNLV